MAYDKRLPKERLFALPGFDAMAVNHLGGISVVPVDVGLARQWLHPVIGRQEVYTGYIPCADPQSLESGTDSPSSRGEAGGVQSTFTSRGMIPGAYLVSVVGNREPSWRDDFYGEARC